jgi:hypothetical protein
VFSVDAAGRAPPPGYTVTKPGEWDSVAVTVTATATVPAGTPGLPATSTAIVDASSRLQPHGSTRVSASRYGVSGT